MSPEYAPGTVAMVTALNRPTPYRAFFDGETWREVGSKTSCLNSPKTVHPLVVLDLPDGAKGGWWVLIDALRRAKTQTGLHMVFGGLIEQIEAQTKQPKPTEPTGLGAVVEEADGKRWVRIDGDIARWLSQDCLFPMPWTHIEAVRVLSEGVSA